MRFAPTAEWSSFSTSVSAIVLILALLPVSYMLREPWFAPHILFTHVGMPDDSENPQPPFKTYGLLVRNLVPAIAKNFNGRPWLPSVVPRRFGNVHDFSAIVLAGQDRIEVRVNAIAPSLPVSIVREYQWSAVSPEVPIFAIQQRSVDRATATAAILKMRTVTLYGVAPEAMGTVRLDGRVAELSYQHEVHIEDIHWTQGSWTVHVTGPADSSADVHRLALEMSRVLDRLALPAGIGNAVFDVDSPSNGGWLSWATSDGLMSAGSRLGALVSIQIARSMTPLERTGLHHR